jgi:hypothetical protein
MQTDNLFLEEYNSFVKQNADGSQKCIHVDNVFSNSREESKEGKIQNKLNDVF